MYSTAVRRILQQLLPHGNGSQNLEETVKTHFDHLADGYATYCLKREAYLRTVEALVATRMAAIDSRPLRILDIGCGPGVRAQRIQRIFSTDCSWYGVDVSKRMLALAAQVGVFQRLDVAHAANLPHADGSFDIVLALFNVMGYIFPAARRRDTLLEVRRVLRPGGLFVSDVLNLLHLQDGSFKVPLISHTGRLIASFVSPSREFGDILFAIPEHALRGAVHAFFPKRFLSAVSDAGLHAHSVRYVGYGRGRIHNSPFAGHLYVEATKWPATSSS